MSAPRPTYVGYGECPCGRLEVLLYRVPESMPSASPVCVVCLLKAGFEEPTPRTAKDLEDIDGQLKWKDES